MPDLPPWPDLLGRVGLAFRDAESAAAAIRATEGWTDAAWRGAAIAAIDRAYLHHADELVLQPLLDDWTALAAAPGD